MWHEGAKISNAIIVPIKSDVIVDAACPIFCLYCSLVFMHRLSMFFSCVFVNDKGELDVGETWHQSRLKYQ